MSQEITVKSNCPHCGKSITTAYDLPENMAPPSVRSKLDPVGTMHVYRISSEQIKEYLTEKVREIVPSTKLDLAPRYTEKKRRSKSDQVHSYASLNIALSDDVIQNGSDNSWFGSIGQDSSSVRVMDDMYKNIIKKYRFDPKDVREWLKDYKIMEDLEENFGMDESFIQELKKFSNPQRVATVDKKSWVVFAAAPEYIIGDMLTDPSTGKIPGRMRINRTYLISKTMVEYIVYLDPTDMDLQEDPRVRQILMGEEKLKK